MGERTSRERGSTDGGRKAEKAEGKQQREGGREGEEKRDGRIITGGCWGCEEAKEGVVVVKGGSQQRAGQGGVTRRGRDTRVACPRNCDVARQTGGRSGRQIRMQRRFTVEQMNCIYYIHANDTRLYEW